MRQLLQSTSRNVAFKAFLAADHVTPATGKTIAITISKNAGTFTNPSGGATNATEIANGWYFVTLTTTDTNTVGDFIVRGTEGTIDPAEQICQVVTDTATTITAINAKTTNLPASPAAVSDIPTANANADALLDRASGVESSWTVREALRVMLGVLAGPATGMGTTTGTINNPGNSKSRVIMTIDANGNRSSPVYDKT